MNYELLGFILACFSVTVAVQHYLNQGFSKINSKISDLEHRLNQLEIEHEKEIRILDKSLEWWKNYDKQRWRE